jgi:hypothetical protein
MKRLALATAVAAALASTFYAAPASATGRCDEKIEVACTYGCVPGDPCTIQICLVYSSGRCVV